MLEPKPVAVESLVERLALEALLEHPLAEAVLESHPFQAVQVKAVEE